MAGVNTTLPRWSPEEDLQLCKSWRFISQDSRKGKDQKKAELWDNVRKHYFENLPDATDQSAFAFIGRWRILKPELFQWHCALRQAKNWVKSGTSPLDEV